MATRDTYTKVHEKWEDQPSENTPIKAAGLEHIEQGIKEAKDNRALKEIYGDNGINLSIIPEESATPAIKVSLSSESDESEEAAILIFSLDQEGNAVFNGNVTNGKGISLNSLQQSINSLEESILGGAS